MLNCRRSLWPLLLLVAVLACSSSEAPRSSLSLAATYHRRSIGSAPLPTNEAGGGTIDSGDVRRIGGDTVRIDTYSHSQPSPEGCQDLT
jgi:hypothetical protein